MKVRDGRRRLEIRVDSDINKSLDKFHGSTKGAKVDDLVRIAREAGFEEKFAPKAKPGTRQLIDTDVSLESHEFFLRMKQNKPGMSKTKVVSEMIAYLNH